MQELREPFVPERRHRAEVQPRSGARRAVALPRDCASFERRLADVAWTHGTLVVPPTPPEPAGLDDGSAAAVLDEAEDILNSAGPTIRAEVEAERARHRSPACSSASSAASADRSTADLCARARPTAQVLPITPTAVGEFRGPLGRIARVSAFSPDAVRDSAGSPWSDWSAFRLAAAERFAAAPLPTPTRRSGATAGSTSSTSTPVRSGARATTEVGDRCARRIVDRRRRTGTVRRRRRPTSSPSSTGHS